MCFFISRVRFSANEGGSKHSMINLDSKVHQDPYLNISVFEQIGYWDTGNNNEQHMHENVSGIIILIPSG